MPHTQGLGEGGPEIAPHSMRMVANHPEQNFRKWCLAALVERWPGGGSEQLAEAASQPMAQEDCYVFAITPAPVAVC